MELYKDGIYWKFRNTRGPVPNELKGEWTSTEFANKALALFQEKVRSRAVNVTEKSRERKNRAISIATKSAEGNAGGDELGSGSDYRSITA